MGVHGLWRLLESTGKPINPETLEGKILAVDISIWLNQAVKGVRDRDGNSVQNAHLLTLFHRICKLLFFRIKPVFVFDGDPPLLKKQTLALRRQRKEELTRESKQTNEKLLKTFLKRQAIKAALGDSSKDPLPSLSSVRRDEVDDMYILPALPPAEEKERSSSEEEEEEKECEETVDSYAYQEEIYDDPNSVDINSEDFASLPPEMKHEILKEMKEFSKRRRTMYQKPPERSGDFSQYQLAGLLQRNRLNQRLEGVEKEMSQRSAGSAPQLGQHDEDQQSHNVESNRLVSEDHSHYILIKGSKKKEITPESQPATAPWSGSSLSGCRKRIKDRPEPLWRPVGEKEVLQAISEESKSSVPKPPKVDAAPPSPRTLKAIQAAMNDSSDEEKVGQVRSVSPRTLMAIQQALTEEEDGASSSTTKLQASLHHSVPQVVISSSEEETQPSPKDELDFKSNMTGQSPHTKDGLFVSSSEDEMEEMIGQRNRALRFAALQQNPKTNVESEEWHASQKKKKKLEDGESEEKPQVAASNQNTLPIDLSPPPCGKPTSTVTRVHPTLLEQRKNKLTEALEEISGDHVKSQSSEESESEESFIEVSEEEIKEEDADDSVVMTEEKSPSGEAHKDGMKKEEDSEGSLTNSPSQPATALNSKEEEEADRQNEENEVKEGTDTESRSTPAVNEWDHLDMDDLEALESSLQMEQSNLREQKQQQERMANTVTGQMYLESQEMLRLFGVPFLVAPMEAEAQCAALDRADQTHGTITDDSDVWLFGGRHVYKNFFSQNKYVEHYQYSDLQNQLGLDRTKMINLAYLLGSDYTEGMPGVGYVTGMEILNEFPGPGMEPLIQLNQWWSEAQEKKRLVADPRDTKVKKKLRDMKLQPGFPNPAVAQAYWHPAVDQSDGSFSWGRPQIDMIKEFCLSRFGWNSRKTEETLQPVIKQLNSQQTQLRIDSFFRMEQQDKHSIRSQRLRRAVTCLKRKETGGGGDGDSEEEMPSPSKSKKESLKNREGQKEEGQSAVAGGFLGSERIGESPLASLKDVCCSVQDSLPVKAAVHSAETLPQRTRGKSSTSSSGEDSDGGRGVAMVTARSVFKGNKRGRGIKGTRGRGSMRGKERGKKL
ncbi:DNA repair protein complementing XP-G cells [Melanotaenia boesemani]|uniref:DNA repair protein complementing XP-G cells n=1 Tax=Melanotaenia boesemani TaxID=1250792 RepID=UPI001C057D6C|nr:DNA repair protein complementing XP-G cells [Melanotaenia boesemani]